MTIEPRHGGCLALTDYHFQGGSFGGLKPCDKEPTWVGVHTYTYPREHTYRCFACDEHKHLLDHPRPFGSHAADALELARRRAGGVAR